MDLKILQEFVCLSKNLSFTKTAKSCYVSQSVLSRHIQALEAELGHQLLIRDKKGIRLTPYGEVFAVSCERMSAEYAKALSRFDGIEDGFSQVLRVAYAVSLPHSYIDAVYEAHLERCPDVELDLRATREENIFKLLEQEKVDLAICLSFDKPNAETYSTMRLFEDRYVALLSDDHALAKREEVKLKDMTGETLLIPSSRDFPIQNARFTEASYGFLGARMRGVLNSEHDAVALAKAGRGIALIRERLLDGVNLCSLATVPVSDDFLKFDILVVWHNVNFNPSLSDFVGILQDFAKIKLS